MQLTTEKKTIQSGVDKDTVAARGSAFVCERRHLRHEKCSHISSGLVAAAKGREGRTRLVGGERGRSLRVRVGTV